MLPVAILTGGLATRLHPITKTIPKALVPVAGRPFIQWQLEHLREQGRVGSFCQAVREADEGTPSSPACGLGGPGWWWLRERGLPAEVPVRLEGFLRLGRGLQEGCQEEAPKSSNF